MKIKAYIKNSFQKILWSAIIVAHLIAFGFLYWYASQTNAVAAVIIYSHQSGEIKIITPIGQSIDKSICYGDTIAIAKRPIKAIRYVDISGEEGLLDIEIISNGILAVDEKGLNIEVRDVSQKKFLSVVDFFFFGLPGMQLYLCCWVFILILLLFWLFLKYRKFRFLKLRFYRFLLKGKGGTRLKVQPIQLKKYQRIVLLIGIFVIIPIMYLHLGKYPFSQNVEEKRRALVSLEMKLNNNFMVPTVCGEPYYNKPPLFNWLILPFVDSKNVEANTRAVSVSILLLLGASLFLMLRKRRGWQHALLSSFLFLTSWYIISQFSFTLNLDGLFAFFLILMFYLNYKFASEQKYYFLFIVGYSLCGLAFLTKGVPAIVFQIISVLFALTVNRELKKVFSLAHLLGILSMVVIIGSYFFLYQFSGGNLYLYISGMWQETMLNNGYSFKMLIRHFFSFPAYNIGAFLPFGFLVPLLFIRSNFIQILKNKELLYLFLLSFMGLSVFWVSSYYLPYYSIMFIPLVGDILLFLMPKFQQDSNRVALNAVLFICIVLLLDWLIGYTIQIPIYSLAFILLYVFRKYIIDILLVISFVFIGWKAIGSINTKLIDSDKQMQTKQVCSKIVDKYPNTKFLILSEETPYNYVTVFYLTLLTGETVEFADAGLDTSALLLAGEEELNISLIVVDTIPQLHWEAGGSEKFLGASVYRPLFVVRNK